jgi:serine/threonine-protein kinase
MVMHRRADKPVPVPTNVGPGTILSKRFKLIKPIGSGGMAVVWLAKHMDLDIPVALKMLRSVDAHSSVARARFEKEARLVAALKHPNVVQILEYGVHGDLPFFAMELLEGETLARRLQRQKTVDPTTIVWIVEQIARPVDRAHAKGIIHRDIKPDNIFLHSTEEGEVPKLVDFGIAKLIDDDTTDSLTRTNAVIGTTHYLSPERARGKKPIDGHADLWALAVVVYECIVGQRPFEDHAGDLLGLLRAIAEVDYPPPSTLRPTPPEFDAWMDQALNPNPSRRFGTAAEMGSALRDALLPGTISSLTGMAFQSLEGAMLTPSAGEGPDATMELSDAIRLPSADDFLEVAEELTQRSEPQLRRFDMGFHPSSVEIEPVMNPTNVAVLEDTSSTVKRLLDGPPAEETELIGLVGEPTRVDVEDVTVAKEWIQPIPLPLGEERPRRATRDWRLYALAAVSLLVASGVGASFVRWVGPRYQGGASADSGLVLPLEAPVRTGGNTEQEPPVVVASTLPSAISVAPPVWDVERLPVPDSESSSPTPSQTHPPGRRIPRPVGTGRKPHEVFGL